jgi:hypothetical protein
MARRTVELTGISGNGTNGTMSLALPMGYDYLSVWLVLDSGTAAITTLTDLKVITNGEILRQYSGSSLNNENLFDLQTSYATNNILRIPFEMLEMKDIRQTYSSTLNTLSVDPATGKAITTARLEWTLAAAVTPVYRVFADVDDSSAGGPGWTMRTQTYTDSISGTSEQGFPKTFPFGTLDRRFLRRLFITASAGTIDLVRILRGASNEEYFKRTRLLNAQALNDGVRSSTGGGFSFVVDFTETGIAEAMDTMKMMTRNGSNALESVQILDPRLTASGAATLTFMWETLGEL